MSETTQQIERRTVLRGAVWSAPVIAAAVAMPMASASTNNAGVTWTDSTTSLADLRLLDSDTVLTANVLPTLPTEYTITNGEGAISAAATVSIRVGRPSGINLPVGRARGFGVYSVDGVVTPPSERSVQYESAPLIGDVGFPITNWTGTRNVSISSNGALVVPVEFGLTGTNSGITVQLLSNFPVTLTVDFGDGAAYTASSNISVPIGAGVL
ncbi:hypothetical protein [Microbacterium sp. YY-01]|uniref:hypothetical protein n=1 Tax=Microbacterium sp. YY-01 TaxID=3421634 RepID=UPI003D182A6B